MFAREVGLGEIDPGRKSRARVRSFDESWRECLGLNPDLLIQRKKVWIEDDRIRYALNQRRPELNLKAAYGLNGLGSNFGDSWEEASGAGFPSWSVGLEFRLPLGGGIKTGNDLYAARLSREQAILTLRSVETQIANALNAAISKVRTTEEIALMYGGIERFNRQLLDARLARLKLGKVEPRKVLEVEADLLEARAGVADAMVQHERAILELQLAEGSTLRSRSLDLTQRELREKTQALIKSRGVTAKQIPRVVFRAIEKAKMRPDDEKKISNPQLKSFRVSSKLRPEI